MTNFKSITKDTKFSETQYYEVAKIQGNLLVLKNEAGEGIEVSKEYAESCLIAADQFEKTETVNKTAAADIFSNNPGVVMTVSYQKQVKADEVEEEIKKAVASTAPKDIDKGIKAAVKKALNGEERTMVGRHYGAQDGFGRYHFIDMEQARDTSKSYDTRQRLVDPRTINWIIVKGTRYNVK